MPLPPAKPSTELAVSRGLNVYALCLGLQNGFFWGKGKEYVYHKNPPLNDSPYWSQLLWDFNPLIYLGIDLDFGPRYPWERNGIMAGFSLKYGLPFSTGIMEDRDWQAIGEDYLTNYSRHDAFCRSYPRDFLDGFGTFSAALTMGFSWAFMNRAWLKAMAELSYLRFSWISRDGYTQYGPTDLYGNYIGPSTPDMPKSNLLGPAINYSQNWVIVAPGVSAEFKISEYIFTSFYCIFSPLVYGAARDDHLNPQKTITYLDILSGGLYLREGMGLEFRVNQFAFAVSAAFMNLSGSRGTTYTTSGGSGYAHDPESKSGAGFSFWNYSISVKYTF